MNVHCTLHLSLLPPGTREIRIILLLHALVLLGVGRHNGGREKNTRVFVCGARFPIPSLLTSRDPPSRDWVKMGKRESMQNRPAKDSGLWKSWLVECALDPMSNFSCLPLLLQMAVVFVQSLCRERLEGCSLGMHAYYIFRSSLV